MPKLIERCAECAYYRSGGRCILGAKVESNPQDPFYDDCPLQDGVGVHTAYYEQLPGGSFRCSACGDERECDKDPIAEYCIKYCVNCGARIVEVICGETD